MAKSSQVSIQHKHPIVVKYARMLASWWRAWAAAALGFILMVVVLWPSRQLAPQNPGEEVFDDIRAPAPLEVLDIDQNNEARRRIDEVSEQIWSYVPQVQADARRKLETAFDILNSNEPQSSADLKRIADEIYAKTEILLSTADVQYLYKNANLRRFADYVQQIADEIAQTVPIIKNEALFKSHLTRRVLYAAPGIPEPMIAGGLTDYKVYPDRLKSYLREYELRRFFPDPNDRDLRELGVKILGDVLQPNLVYNEAETAARRQGRLQRLAEEPPVRTYAKGDLIVQVGDRLTPTQAAALAELNELRRQAQPYRVAGVALLAFFCLAGVIFYLSRLRNDLKFTAPNVTMVCLPLLITFGVGRMLIFLDLDPEFVSVLYPSALVGLLSTIMIGASAGFILVLASSIFFGVATGQEFGFYILSLFGGFAAVISLRSLRERKDILETGLHVGLINVATVLLLAFFSIPFRIDGRLLLSGFLNGLACAFIALPLMAIFERAFGVVTDIRLLELTSPDNKLIRMMEERSPGTYQHVLNVTKLAESAAEAIGANFLLVRAGAYFHDIGKSLRPKYFTENQVTLDDKKAHTRLSPYMSVLIIKNHVRDGIDLAKEYHLPQRIIDFIPEHHGTSLIKYFYNEALQRYQETESTDVVREEDFRYPGPKPQSIETAIVMLADSVEAITTSVFTSSRVNEYELRRVVEQAVSDRFQDGQFDECDLTMRDLYLIRESFVKTLKARFHQRIAYPTLQRRESARERGERGDTREATNPALAPVMTSHG
jgi:putative nucleotidyltransferase with HDIG domain